MDKSKKLNHCHRTVCVCVCVEGVGGEGWGEKGGGRRVGGEVCMHLRPAVHSVQGAVVCGYGLRGRGRSDAMS